jgi:type I restriction enzyme, S subunit
MDNDQLTIDNSQLVPAGYKRTEVGVIPEDWDVDKLGNCLIGSPDYGVNAPAVPYKDGLPVYIRITDITDDGHFSKKNITSVKVADPGKYLLNSGELVFARTGASVGKSYLYNPEDGELVFAGFLIRVKPNPVKLVPRFLSAYIKTGSYWDWVKSVSMRSGQPGINSTQYAKLPIPIPPLPEQRAIAEVLSDVDALIAALDRIIAKKRAIKQGAMQQLLTGQTRLPGFSGPWEMKRLGEIANIFSGGTPSTSIASYYGGEIPWITSSDLNKNYIYEVKGKITEQGLKNSSAQMVNANTLLIALYGATSGVTAITRIRAAINQAVLAIIPQVDDSLFLFFKLSYLKKWLIDTFTQGGQPNLSGRIIKSLEIPFPSLPEQRAIADVLSDMDAEIAALEARRDKTRAIKQGMMQQLLTGRIRLIN